MFFTYNCKLDPEVVVTQLVWSNVDPLAAMACTVYDQDRDKSQVLFINNEVKYYKSNTNFVILEWIRSIQ